MQQQAALPMPVQLPMDEATQTAIQAQGGLLVPTPPGQPVTLSDEHGNQMEFTADSADYAAALQHHQAYVINANNQLIQQVQQQQARPGSRVQLLDLPPEILSYVAQYLVGADLKRVTLVHRKCREIALPHLFKELSTSFESNISQGHNTLNVSSKALSQVQEVRLHFLLVGRDKPARLKDSARILYDGQGAILHHLSNLKRVALRIDTPAPVELDELDVPISTLKSMLGTVGHSKVQIAFPGLIDKTGVLSVIDAVLDSLPPNRVSRMELSELHGLQANPSDPGELSFTGRVHRIATEGSCELQLAEVTKIPLNLATYMFHGITALTLIFDSTETEERARPEMEQIVVLLQACRGPLQKLAIDLGYPFEVFELFETLESVPKLPAMILEEVKLKGRTLVYCPSWLETLDVKTISLTAGEEAGRLAVEQLATSLDLPSVLPRLQSIEINFDGPLSAPAERFETLLNACAARSIRLRVRMDDSDDALEETYEIIDWFRKFGSALVTWHSGLESVPSTCTTACWARRSISLTWRNSPSPSLIDSKVETKTPLSLLRKPSPSSWLRSRLPISDISPFLSTHRAQVGSRLLPDWSAQAASLCCKA